MSRLVVQKFGGSSLSTYHLRLLAARRVEEARRSGLAPVVVVSALGRSPDPYATDSLKTLLSQRRDANTDLVLACGELLSAGVFADLLQTLEIPALAVSGSQAGIITDDGHGSANVLSIEVERILRLVGEGTVPVIAGFQGATVDGTFTTLGRGGSDLTAVVLACALGQAELEIYTDVDGVCTSDPKHDPDAKTLARLSFEELCRLAADGARVMQLRAAEFAKATRTSLRILGLKSGIGTLISDPD